MNGPGQMSGVSLMRRDLRELLEARLLWLTLLVRALELGFVVGDLLAVGGQREMRRLWRLVSWKGGKE